MPKFKLNKFLGSLNKKKQSLNAQEYVSGLNTRSPAPLTQKQIYIQARKDQAHDRKQEEKARKDYQRQREFEANQKIVHYEQRKREYDNSRTGKFNRGVAKTFNFIKSPTRAIYQAEARPRLARNPYAKVRRIGRGVSGRGRPYGTVKYVNPETGQPIGVYEYRKILSAQLRNQRMQSIRNNTLNPMQQQALQRLDAQERYNQSNIESRPIPDTTGQVNLRSIHQEADDYAHLFD